MDLFFTPLNYRPRLAKVSPQFLPRRVMKILANSIKIRPLSLSAGCGVLAYMSSMVLLLALALPSQNVSTMSQPNADLQAAPAPTEGHKSGKVQVIYQPTGLVVLEAPVDRAVTTVALPPGEYLVQWQAAAGHGEKVVKLELDQRQLIAEAGVELRGTAYASAAAPGVPPLGPVELGEKKESGARAQLAFYQTLHGIGVGIEVCVLADCNDAKVWVSLPTLGGLIGLGASLLATRNGITQGHALAINTGTTWGFWQALAIGGMDSDNLTAKGWAGILLAGQLVGLGVGEAVGELAQPRAGTVLLADTAGTWAGVITLLGHAASSFSASKNATWLSLLAASDAGFVLGAVGSQYLQMSGGRTLIIDAGGILGLAVGMAAAVVFSKTPSEHNTFFFSSAIAGSVIGLGLATWLSSGWDAPELPAHVMILPTQGGGLAAVSIDL
jgi:hypothetical protein